MMEVAAESHTGNPRKYLSGETYINGLPYALSARLQALMLSTRARYLEDPTDLMDWVSLLFCLKHFCTRKSSRKALDRVLINEHRGKLETHPDFLWRYWGNKTYARNYKEYWESLLPADISGIEPIFTYGEVGSGVAETPDKISYARALGMEQLG